MTNLCEIARRILKNERVARDANIAAKEDAKALDDMLYKKYDIYKDVVDKMKSLENEPPSPLCRFSRMHELMWIKERLKEYLIRQECSQ